MFQHYSWSKQCTPVIPASEAGERGSVFGPALHTQQDPIKKNRGTKNKK